jgi:hypothetical protein
MKREMISNFSECSDRRIHGRFGHRMIQVFFILQGIPKEHRSSKTHPLVAEIWKG